MDREELRAAILAADDLPTETVDIPEWDTKLTVRGLTSAEKDSYASEISNFSTGEFKWRNATALLVARSVIDDDGERIFQDEDAAALGDKSAAALQRLFDAATRLSAFTAGDMEEIERDFGPAQNDGSSSG